MFRIVPRSPATCPGCRVLVPQGKNSVTSMPPVIINNTWTNTGVQAIQYPPTKDYNKQNENMQNIKLVNNSQHCVKKNT